MPPALPLLRSPRLADRRRRRLLLISLLTFLFIHAPRHVRQLGIANDDGANGGM